MTTAAASSRNICRASFEPGFSTKIDYETGKVSRGLGLSLVRDIIESQMGGTIRVQSEEGCTDFIISIPQKKSGGGKTNEILFD